jgi:hypothetical protein
MTEQSTPDSAQTPPPPGRRSPWLWILTAAALALGALCVVVVNAIAGEDAPAAAPPETKLRAAYDMCDAASESGITGVKITDSDHTLIMTTQIEFAGIIDSADLGSVGCMSQRLRMPAAVAEQIASTSKIDEQKTANWGAITARWIYESTGDLNIVLTEK